jgi:hypothetical protein
MKKSIFIIMLVMLLGVVGCSGTLIPAFAAEGDLAVMAPDAAALSVKDILTKIPGLKQGVGFSLIENELNYLTTVELISYKGFAFEAGYDSKDKAVAVISADLINLKKMGVAVPVLDLIDLRVGLYGGYGSINSQEIDRSEWDAGISATAVSIKF